MKKVNTIYWITTGLFCAFMLFSAIPDILMVPEATVFMEEHLGYPAYFTPFIGIAKTLGVIALLIPGYPRVKEWAYAGLFFDLVGAVYSNLMVDGFLPGMLVMVLPFAFFFISYRYHHKRLNGKMAVAVA